MRKTFVALTFALSAIVEATHEDNTDCNYPNEPYEQTPQPFWDQHDLIYMDIPSDFGKFDNNFEYIGVGWWYDGDYSNIFNWLDNNFEKNCIDYFHLTGYVSGVKVAFLREVLPSEDQYICFFDEFVENY